MRQYLRIITVALLVTGIAFGCKKDSTPKPTCRIITASGTGGQVNFNYNSEGKLISVSSGTFTTSFAYSGNIVVAIKNNAGVFESKQIITLNSNGLASNQRVETDMAGTTWENYASEYSGTEIIKQTYTNSDGDAPRIVTCNWSGGNLISSSASGINSAFEYYTDKAAQPGDYLHFTQLQQGFQVIRNKNSVKSVLAGSNISNFDYTHDADGKITTLILTGSSSATLTYQYQCN
jgi:hypothetical protein